MEAFGPQAALRLTIQRNCSISPRALRLLLAAMVAVSFGIGTGFAVFGAWAILPFAGLEMLALTAAFCCVSRHAGDYEKFVEEQGALRVEFRDAGETRACEFNPLWVRVVVRMYGREPCLALCSHGREFPIGHQMNAEGRRALAGRLAQRLSSYQKR